MAAKDKDKLADALAALAGGEHHEADEHAEDVQSAPAPKAPAARVQIPRPVAVRPAVPPRPVAPQVARPQTPAKVRPAAPASDFPEPSPRRPQSPEFGITPQAPSEAASPSEFVASEVPCADAAEPQDIYEQTVEAGDEAQDPFVTSVEDYVEQPDAEQIADDEMIAPAPEVSDFLKHRYDPALRGLDFKQKLIPTLLVLGMVLAFAPLGGLAFASEESGFRMLPNYLLITSIVIGVLLLGSAGVLMAQVSYQLKRKAALAAQAPA